MFLDLLEAKQVNVSVTFVTPESGCEIIVI